MARFMSDLSLTGNHPAGQALGPHDTARRKNMQAMWSGESGTGYGALSPTDPGIAGLQSRRVGVMLLANADGGA